MGISSGYVAFPRNVLFASSIFRSDVAIWTHPKKAKVYRVDDSVERIVNSCGCLSIPGPLTPPRPAKVSIRGHKNTS